MKHDTPVPVDITDSPSLLLADTKTISLDLEQMNDTNFSLGMLAPLNKTNNSDAWRNNWTVSEDNQWQTVVIIFYSLVMIFGFFANILIVVVIVRYKQLHTVTNIFICYLAIADVALCVFNLPLQLHYQISKTWMFGRVLCYVAMPTFGVPLFSSTLSILMIAVDRYMLIVHPFKTRMTNCQAIIAVALIIIFTIALSTPIMVFVEYVEVTLSDSITKEKQIFFCLESWPAFANKQIYTVSIFLLQFVLPLCLTSFFYKHICYVLRHRPVKKQDTRRNQRTNKILIAVVLTFTICWLPWNLFSLTAEFSHKLVKGEYFTLTDLMFKVFAMSSACINPFLYGWLNDNFKKELEKLFGCCLHCRRSNKHESSSLTRTTDINGFTPKSEMYHKSTPDITVV